jgi:AcrR family transcriptional regulator
MMSLAQPGNEVDMPRRTPPEQPERSGDTALRALQCLDEIARQKGLDDVSMRDVARRVGVSLAALQYHYPTKAALFDAFVQHSVESYRERIARIVTESESQKRFVNILAFLACETVLASRGGVLTMIEARAQHDDASRRAWQRFVRSYLEVMGGVIAAELPDLPPEEVLLCATLVCAQLEGLASTHEAACELGADPSTLLVAFVQAAVSTVAQRAACGHNAPRGRSPRGAP